MQGTGPVDKGVFADMNGALGRDFPVHRIDEDQRLAELDYSAV
jgi:hypothetical protein